MSGSRMLDVAIGLAFIFGVTAALAAALTELIARFLGLRARYLLRGLRTLVDGDEKTTLRLTQIQYEYDRFKKQVRENLRAAEPLPVAAVVGTGGGSGFDTRTGGRPDPQAPRGAPAAGDAGAAEPEWRALGAVLGNPVLRSQGLVDNLDAGPLRVGEKGRVTADQRGGVRRQLRALPSYIPPRSFAGAVLDVVVPDGRDATTIDEVRVCIEAMPNSHLKKALLSLVKSAGNDVAAFRTSIEHWYDDHMARVSGWYKRRAAVITTVVGSFLVVLFNVNALTIGRTLYTSPDTARAVTDVAVAAADKGAGACKAGATEGCLNTVKDQVDKVVAAGLPIGWGTVGACVDRPCDALEQRGLLNPDDDGFDSRPLKPARAS